MLLTEEISDLVSQKRGLDLCHGKTLKDISDLEDGLEGINNKIYELQDKISYAIKAFLVGSRCLCNFSLSSNPFAGNLFENAPDELISAVEAARSVHLGEHQNLWVRTIKGVKILCIETYNNGMKAKFLLDMYGIKVGGSIDQRISRLKEELESLLGLKKEGESK